MLIGLPKVRLMTAICMHDSWFMNTSHAKVSSRQTFLMTAFIYTYEPGTDPGIVNLGQDLALLMPLTIVCCNHLRDGATPFLG